MPQIRGSPKPIASTPSKGDGKEEKQSPQVRGSPRPAVDTSPLGMQEEGAAGQEETERVAEIWVFNRPSLGQWPKRRAEEMAHRVERGFREAGLKMIEVNSDRLYPGERRL